MSLANPTENVVNPVQAYVRWQGKKGFFSYFDKEKLNEKNEKGCDVVLKNFRFLIIDMLFSVSGYNEKGKYSILSNQIRNTQTEQFLVNKKINFGGRVSFEKISNGFWKEIKKEVEGCDGKFTYNIFAMAYIKEISEIPILVRIDIHGDTLFTFVKYLRENKLKWDSGLTFIHKANEAKKQGANDYFVPVFSHETASKEGLEKAIKIETELLKPYFDARKNSAIVDDNKSETQQQTNGDNNATSMGTSPQTAGINVTPTPATDDVNPFDAPDDENLPF